MHISVSSLRMRRMASPAAFRFDTSKRPVFVVGNEAADVDSLVSAPLGYTEFRLALQSCKVEGQGTVKTLYKKTVSLSF